MSRADDAPEVTEAAVTLPLHRDDRGRLRLVLISRTHHGRHGGQVALPGGRREPDDATPQDTALRETCEELGIGPRSLTMLAALDPVLTRTTGFAVRPYVARLDVPVASLHRQQLEVAQVLDLLVDDLADPARISEEEMSFAGWSAPRLTRVLRIGDHVVWGLTLRILEPALPRALAGTYDV